MRYGTGIRIMTPEGQKPAWEEDLAVCERKEVEGRRSTVTVELVVDLLHGANVGNTVRADWRIACLCVGRSPMKEAVACYHSCLSVLRRAGLLSTTPSPLSPQVVQSLSRCCWWWSIPWRCRQESSQCWDTYEGRWVLKWLLFPPSPLLLG